MTDSSSSSAAERIAKVMARAGVASRRDAEKLIVAGRVAVNGKVVASPALDVLPSDRVTLDGKPIDAPQPAKLWLYYKPLGLVTSARDEKGRQTVFDTLPEDMPRVMSVGRLDLNSEGLLLLTNDGALKRRLELPSTGWLRKYRVRVNGRPNDATFDPLRRGVVIEGETFLPMEVVLDKQQGANAWLTVGLREGRNREIRRAMSEVGLIVNRLIRVSYGPFRLNTMKPGDVVEVKARVLRDQLGDETSGESGEDRPRRPREADSRKPRFDGDKPFDRARKPREQAEGERRDYKPRPPREGDAPRKPRFDGPKSFDRPRGDDGDRPRKPREQAEGERREYKPRPPREGDAPRKPRFDGPKSFDRPRGDDGDRPRKPREQAEGERREYKPRPPREGDAPRGPAKGGYKGDRPDSGARGKPAGGARFGDKPGGGFKGKAGGSRPAGSGSKPFAGGPKGPRKGPSGPRRGG